MGNAESSSSSEENSSSNNYLKAGAAVAAGAALAWGASQLLSSKRSQAQEQYANNNTSPNDNYHGPPISWELPPPKWYKINCDGSSTQSHSGIGYIIRDHRGEVIAAEAIFNTSITDITEAEAEAICKGLKEALQKGLRNVILETDNESVAKMVIGVGSPGRRMENIICEIVRVKSQFNQCEVRHVNRNANRCADYLAGLGARGKPWRFGQEPVPEGLLRLLENDKIGARIPVSCTSNTYLKVGGAVATGAALAWGASQLLSSNRSEAQEQYANNNTSPYHNYYGHESDAGTLLEGGPSDGFAPITWERPPPNWCKINCDASTQTHSGIGYIIRDHQGDIIAAGALSSTQTDNTVAEAEAILKGLEAALQNRLINVILETDNESVADMINGVENPGKKMENIIQEIKIRVKQPQFDQCQIRFRRRETNRCANHLAKLGRKRKPWRFGQGPLPEGLRPLLNDDKIGV